MTQFDEKEFQHLQKLCRLNCTPEEAQRVHRSIQDVLEYLKQLEKVDTRGVSPCGYVLRSEVQDSMRSDEGKDLLPREEFLREVPEQTGGMVRTPPVLKVL
jgi:aspartyl-tRNA(Asn)/glutamyl-tRNA(Gln) amidotransferase subunit C